jgi:hypothetical protein
MPTVLRRRSSRLGPLPPLLRRRSRSAAMAFSPNSTRPPSTNANRTVRQDRRQPLQPTTAGPVLRSSASFRASDHLGRTQVTLHQRPSLSIDADQPIGQC